MVKNGKKAEAANKMAVGHEKKVMRIIRLYDRLMSGRRVYLPDVADEFKVDLRTLQRDMADLSEMEHLPVVSERVDGRKEYMLMNSATRFPVTFGLSDIIVAKMALQMMQQFKGTGLVVYIQTLAQRVNDRLNHALAERVRNLDKKLYSHHTFTRNYRRSTDQFEEILAAILYQDKLKIHYHSIGSNPHWHIVRPYTLMSYKTGLYLIAKIDDAPENAKPTTFALERIQKALRQKEKFDLPGDWDPKKNFPSLGGLLPGKEEDVVIHFDPTVEAYLKHLLWPRKTKITPKNKSTLEFKSHIHVNDEIVNWIIGFGPLAKVVEPQSLVDQVKEKLTATLERYS